MTTKKETAPGSGGLWFHTTLDYVKWNDLIESLSDFPHPLPTFLVELDIVYFNHRLCYCNTPFPSMRELAERWNWKLSTAYRMVKQKRNTNETPVKQEWNTRAPLKLLNEGDVKQEWNTSETEVKQQRNTPPSEAAKKADNQAPLISNKNKNNINIYGDELLQVWGIWCKYKRRARKSPSKQAAKHLTPLLKVYGADDFEKLFRWAAESHHERAKYLRKNGYVQIPTLCRHIEAYLELADGPAIGEYRPDESDKEDYLRGQQKFLSEQLDDDIPF